jgi:hypothetical protein
MLLQQRTLQHKGQKHAAKKHCCRPQGALEELKEYRESGFSLFREDEALVVMGAHKVQTS